ncbi:hypothetical protein DW651_17420 [Subdoligranulum sp. AM23-21AC]|nr:hypothetical protein DW651_17420 [Subdoligranulum sp. AM23-21AC]RJW01609.1 hypothetical protein DWW15_06685 [Subdoligranulum sp. AF14-43]RJW26060.1 hypothetical protein DXC43_15155 [Subdoligranulum sp. TF05-17AC]
MAFLLFFLFGVRRAAGGVFFIIAQNRGRANTRPLCLLKNRLSARICGGRATLSPYFPRAAFTA